MPAKAKAAYRLVRTTPGGQEYTQSPIATKRAATVFAAYVLYDNARVPKSEAQRFSVTLGSKPLGTTVCHEGTGYTFRIEQES